MKRKTRTRNIFIITVIALLVIGIAIFSVSQTVFKGANKISCGDSSINTWECETIGLGGVGTDAGRINFRITEPSRSDTWSSMLADKSSDINPDIKQFYKTHTFFNQYGTIFRYVPNDVENNWDTRISGITNVQLEYTTYGWEVDTGKMYEETLGKQIIILEGTLTPQEESLEPKSVKTWGLCEGGNRKCYVWDIPDSGIEDILKAESITIYFKKGGYELSDACLDFGLDCPKEVEEEVEEVREDVVQDEETEAIIPEAEEEKIIKEIEQEAVEVEEVKEEAEKQIEVEKETKTGDVVTVTDDGISIYAIVGIIVGLIVVILVILIIFGVIRKRR